MRSFRDAGEGPHTSEPLIVPWRIDPECHHQDCELPDSIIRQILLYFPPENTRWHGIDRQTLQRSVNQVYGGIQGSSCLARVLHHPLTGHAGSPIPDSSRRFVWSFRPHFGCSGTRIPPSTSVERRYAPLSSLCTSSFKPDGTRCPVRDWYFSKTWLFNFHFFSCTKMSWFSHFLAERVDLEPTPQSSLELLSSISLALA